MPKFATKAADNMFCQARYEAAKFNERLSSREGAAEELGVDRTRLARIELGSVTPYPEEVLLMADIYRAPELKGNYCREMCPLGKGMPKIENQDIDRIALRALCSFRKINEVIELESNYSVDNVKEAFLSALKTYYRTAKDNEEIRYTVVSALLSNTAGVIDFSGLKINSGTDNIAVAADYYPVTTLSDLDFTEG